MDDNDDNDEDYTIFPVYIIMSKIIVLYCISRFAKHPLQCAPIRGASSARAPRKRKQSLDNGRRHLDHQLVRRNESKEAVDSKVQGQ